MGLQLVDQLLVKLIARYLELKMIPLCFAVFNHTGKVQSTNMICIHFIQGAITVCQILNSRIDPVRQKMSNPTWKDLIARCQADGVDLSAKAMYE